MVSLLPTIEDRRAARAALLQPAERPAPPPEPEPQADEPPADAPPRPEQARRVSLVEKHRPRRLADVADQPEAVAALSAFARAPYPAAFILHGDTGTGKSSAALALAAELGCEIGYNPPELGGLWSIPSGEHTADALREIWPGLWTRPFCGSGWRVVVVNEVEALNGKVEQLWLDKLEDLPPQTVIVFTTNKVESLPSRFVDRCQPVEFRGGSLTLANAARELAGRVWKAETGQDIPEDVLSVAMSRAVQSGRLSFRRVVQSLVGPLAAR